MKSFIFITSEGYTFQPNSTAVESDVENLQVIGFANGNNQEDAFAQLLLENKWLRHTNFHKVRCYELADADYQKHSGTFYI